MSSQTNTNNTQAASLEELCFVLPLYQDVEIDPTRKNELLVNIAKTHKYDCYCPHCGMLSTFIYTRDIELSRQLNLHLQLMPSSHGGFTSCSNLYKDLQPYRTFRWTCTRCSTQEIFCIFLVLDSSIKKIGQYPTLVDLQAHVLQKYKTMLKEYYTEARSAAILFSHSYAVGAFLYLRRVFEFILNEAQQEMSRTGTWNTDNKKDFTKMHIEEKIEILKPVLPPILVEERKVYKVLSKGAHELSEAECALYFPVVNATIECILDAKLNALNKQQQEKAVSTELAKIHETLQNRTTDTPT